MEGTLACVFFYVSVTVAIYQTKRYGEEIAPMTMIISLLISRFPRRRLQLVASG